jgi:hypothetical protein
MGHPPSFIRPQRHVWDIVPMVDGAIDLARSPNFCLALEFLGNVLLWVFLKIFGMLVLFGFSAINPLTLYI